MQCYIKGSYDKIICSLYWKVIHRYSVVKELHLQIFCSQRITPVVQSQLPIFELKRLGYAIALWKKLLNMSKMNHFNKTSLFLLTSYLLISKSSFLSIELQSDKEIGKLNFQTRSEEERKKMRKKWPSSSSQKKTLQFVQKFCYSKTTTKDLLTFATISWLKSAHSEKKEWIETKQRVN